MIKLDPDMALAELCKRSLYRFVQEFWSVVIPEEPVYNWHIKYLCDELMEINERVEARLPKLYDLIINIPPGSTKSTICTVMYPAWVWTRDASQRFISISFAQDIAIGHAVKSRDIILSAKYQKLFPDISIRKDFNNKSNYKNTLGGQRLAASTGGIPTGEHGHQLLVDDPQNVNGAESAAERKSSNYAVTNGLSTRKVDKKMTPMIVITQRLHEEDTTGVLLSKKGKRIKHICLPAELSDHVKPAELKERYVDGLLDPVRLDRQVLSESKVELGSYGYAGQFDQRPAPDDGGLIKKTWFEIIDWSYDLSKLKWNFTADTAYTKEEKNDPSGYLAYAKHQNDYIIREAETELLEFPDLCRSLPSFCKKNGYDSKSLIEIEPKASGKSLVQTLKRETSLNIKEGKPPAKDKVARVKVCLPTMEAGRVKLVRGTWNKEFLDQLGTFPNATHDEYVDCITMMIAEKRSGGLGKSKTH